MLNFEIFVADFFEVLTVVPKTLALAVIIFMLSLLVGTVMALIQEYKIPVLSQLVWLFKMFMRGTPLIVIIFIMYYSLPMLVGVITSALRIDFNPYHLSPEVILIVALTLTMSSFQSETIRGSFLSVSYGQIEAARSLGYSSFQTFRRIIFPQALVEAIPEFGSAFLVIMKAISLGFMITVIDIFAKARLVASLNSYYLEAFLVAALLYWAIAYLVTFIAYKYESFLLSRS